MTVEHAQVPDLRTIYEETLTAERARLAAARGTHDAEQARAREAEDRALLSTRLARVRQDRFGLEHPADWRARLVAEVRALSFVFPTAAEGRCDRCGELVTAEQVRTEGLAEIVLPLAPGQRRRRHATVHGGCAREEELA